MRMRKIPNDRGVGLSDIYVRFYYISATCYRALSSNERTPFISLTFYSQECMIKRVRRKSV